MAIKRSGMIENMCTFHPHSFIAEMNLDGIKKEVSSNYTIKSSLTNDLCNLVVRGESYRMSKLRTLYKKNHPKIGFPRAFFKD